MHTVRLRAYAISPCLRLPSSSPFPRSLSLSLCFPETSVANALPFRCSFGHSLPFLPSHFRTLRCLQSFFLSFSARISESRNRGRSGRKPSESGCTRWSNGTLSPRVSQRSARARAARLSRGLIKNNFSYLHRGTSSLVRALPDLAARL